MKTQSLPLRLIRSASEYGPLPNSCGPLENSFPRRLQVPRSSTSSGRRQRFPRLKSCLRFRSTPTLHAFRCGRREIRSHSSGGPDSHLTIGLRTRSHRSRARRTTGGAPLRGPIPDLCPTAKVSPNYAHPLTGPIPGAHFTSRHWSCALDPLACVGPTTPKPPNPRLLRSIRPKRAASPSSALQSNSPDGIVPCVSQKRSPPKESGRLDTVRTISGRHPGLGCGVAAVLPNQQVHICLVVTRNSLGKTTLPPKAFVISISSVPHAKRFLGHQWATAID